MYKGFEVCEVYAGHFTQTSHIPHTTPSRPPRGEAKASPPAPLLKVRGTLKTGRQEVKEFLFVETRIAQMEQNKTKLSS